MDMKVRDTAPGFTLLDQDGKAFVLHEHLGTKGLVVFFYPKDDSGVCTTEVCAFRDRYETFLKLGVEVVGISGDSISSHRNFAAKHKLTFPILSDPDGEVRKLFGVPKALGFMPGRVTYLLDRDGVVVSITNDLLHAEKHIEEAIAKLQR